MRLILEKIKQNIWGIAVVIPFVMLLWTIPDLQRAQDEINDTLLHGKMLEVEHIVDVIAAASEANPSRTWGHHLSNIKDSVGYLDELPLVFAAAYMPTNNGLEIITRRDNATTFSPLVYPEFLTAVKNSERGELVIGFHPDGGLYRDMHLYFRWMPLYSPPDERYLVVTAVSEFSITIKVADWVLSTPLRNTIMTGLICLWNIIMSLRMGKIWSKRKGEKNRLEAGDSDV